MKQIDCPCGTGKKYEECCKPYHLGKLPENALLLMRSRYSAYALGLSEYIIHTTHPSHPSWKKEKASWEKEISLFSSETQFQRLEILAFVDGEKEAEVTFKAHLLQNGQDASFTELSHFEKVQGKWLYLSGQYVL
jgi:SEC-C motif-containing protein